MTQRVKMGERRRRQAGEIGELDATWFVKHLQAFLIAVHMGEWERAAWQQVSLTEPGQ